MPEARIISLRDRDEGSGRDSGTRGRRATCSATGPSGRKCRGRAVVDGLCAEHAALAAEHPVARPPSTLEQKVASTLAFVRRRLEGEYPIDEFGFDPDLNDHVFMAAVRPIYERWFRVETRGIDNVPDEGGVLLVANHSGTVPVDGVMTQLALLDHHPAHRHMRMLGADLVFRVPFLAPMARKSGHKLACNPDAERLLSSGELVGVYPEGFKGIGKPISERYKLQRFGRGGFVHAALRTGAPIIPMSVVGSEEIHPVLCNARPLARFLNLPYSPITPTFPLWGPLGLIPLPRKWHIEFGEPIETAQH